jgi:putative transposase
MGLWFTWDYFVTICTKDHIHAIIVLHEASVETPHWGVSTSRNWRSGTLGVIINQYKSVCAKRIRTMGCEDFAWQALFYDHIVRNERKLDNIRSYIQGNPIKWAEDEYFSNL